MLDSSWHRVSRLLKIALLSLLAAFTMELIIVTLASLEAWDQDFSLAPRSYDTVWEIAGIVLVFYLVRKLRAHLEPFFRNVFIFGIISFLFWAVVPETLHPSIVNYYGIESRKTMEQYDWGTGGERVEYVYSLHTGYLYNRNSPDLQSDIRKETRENEYVALKGFLFWQTGVAYGFIPDWSSIPSYHGDYSLHDRLLLFATVGPVALLEVLIRGVIWDLPVLLLIQVLFCLASKGDTWWMWE